MTTEENKSYAEKNEERVEKAIDKIEETLTDNDKKGQETKAKNSSNK